MRGDRYVLGSYSARDQPTCVYICIAYARELLPSIYSRLRERNHVNVARARIPSIVLLSGTNCADNSQFMYKRRAPPSRPCVTYKTHRRITARRGGRGRERGRRGGAKYRISIKSPRFPFVKIFAFTYAARILRAHTYLYAPNIKANCAITSLASPSPSLKIAQSGLGGSAVLSRSIVAPLIESSLWNRRVCARARGRTAKSRGI